MSAFYSAATNLNYYLFHNYSAYYYYCDYYYMVSDLALLVLLNWFNFTTTYHWKLYLEERLISGKRSIKNIGTFRCTSWLWLWLWLWRNT